MGYLKKIGLTLLFACLCLLMSGCGRQADTLVLATFGENPELQKQVELFNGTHQNIKIELQVYNRFEEKEGDGIERLKREIISGKGPDIINFGGGYSVTDILGEYTEDLLPYFERLSQEKEDTYFPNILQAFTHGGGLYAVPVSFQLKTYAGRGSVLGEREKWSVEELISCYLAEKEKAGGSLLLYPGETKKDVFASLIMGSMDNYVDWEKKTCSFDSEAFRTLLEFANQFPESLQIEEEFSVRKCFADGQALLYPVRLTSLYDICDSDAVFGEKAVYVGYPTAGEDGTVVETCGLMLAISGVSKQKEAAWEFISQFFEKEYQENIERGFPLSESAFAEKLAQGRITEYETDAEGRKNPVIKKEIFFAGEEADAYPVYQLTEEQEQILLQIIKKASVGSAYDYELHALLLEETESYFCGDKKAEEVVKIIQSIASIYVNEY